MRTVWKDIATLVNTACISGIVCYEHCRDSDASIIIGFAIFTAAMLMYLLFKTIWKRHRRRG